MLALFIKDILTDKLWGIQEKTLVGPYLPLKE
jgi:hypothetical protein